MSTRTTSGWTTLRGRTAVSSGSPRRASKPSFPQTGNHARHRYILLTPPPRPCAEPLDTALPRRAACPPARPRPNPCPVVNAERRCILFRLFDGGVHMGSPLRRSVQRALRTGEGTEGARGPREAPEPTASHRGSLVSRLQVTPSPSHPPASLTLSGAAARQITYTQPSRISGRFDPNPRPSQRGEPPPCRGPQARFPRAVEESGPSS